MFHVISVIFLHPTNQAISVSLKSGCEVDKFFMVYIKPPAGDVPSLKLTQSIAKVLLEKVPHWVHQLLWRYMSRLEIIQPAHPQPAILFDEVSPSLVLANKKLF